ncbi:hypothetical protein HMPREF1624_08786 [Sporothrix schenckii ATCC 58251]|uniref:Non-homologous end-joining factor 1 n=1 Tax=Sporothrix schenckii (strain ATCC 58251 / de Perez 2211183) TaxID=1391915 RepID=U7PH59_SPOS1|nr:hypothetical protein HMPREF1624_08786 [Sporothrix schenckii ATCC 58251]
MDDRRAWRLLPAAHPDVPVLLVATSFGPAAYSVYVTDLAHVWAERLERRAICMRAFQENTTIDPSYDNEQMGVFLGKLQAALAGDAIADGDANAETRLSLAAAPKADGDLVLHITSVLPGGLSPLQWPVHLTRQPARAVAAALVLPLVHDRAAHQRTEARLVAALQDKDAVINKLADKLEAMGAGVESAFPTLAGGAGTAPSARRGGRKVARADMEARVRGLARFDEATFRKQMQAEDVQRQRQTDEDGADATSTVTQLVEAAFGSGVELRYDADTDAGGASPSSPSLDGWWQALGTGLGVPLKRTGPATGSNSQQSGSRNDRDAAASDEQGDGAFQEATPNKTKAAAAEKTNAAPKKEAEETKPDEDDPPSLIPAKAKAGLGKIGRLGAIGKKPKAKSPSPQPPVGDKEDGKGYETASDAEDLEPPTTRATEKKEAKTAVGGDDDEKETTPTVTTASLRTKPARGGLGRIGGKKEKQPTPEPEQEPEPEPEPEAESEAGAEPTPLKKSTAKAAKGGLGHIGKGKPAAAKKEASDDEDTGKRKAAQEDEETKPADAPPPPKEDASKRAEVLQKAVEKHAAPVRKKRKF